MEKTERDEAVPFCFKCTEYLWEYYVCISEGYIGDTRICTVLLHYNCSRIIIDIFFILLILRILQ